MIEKQGSDGRLIVVLPVRVRHGGRVVCVFLDGRMVAEFPSVGEAARHAGELAQGRCPGPREASIAPRRRLMSGGGTEGRGTPLSGRKWNRGAPQAISPTLEPEEVSGGGSPGRANEVLCGPGFAV